jgi:hypothetical protein
MGEANVVALDFRKVNKTFSPPGISEGTPMHLGKLPGCTIRM